MLEIKNLNISYKNTNFYRKKSNFFKNSIYNEQRPNKIISDFYLKVANNEIVSIMGKSGSGKTTLLNGISGFLNIDSGDILIDNISIKNTKPYKRNIGYVFQDLGLFENKTVKQNIEYGLKIKKIKKENRKIIINDLLKMVQLENKINFSSHILSGGEKQRLALIRTLATKPKILLLDEPFTALDVDLKEKIMNNVKKFIKENNLCVLLVTHIKNEANFFSDRVLKI